MTFAPGRRSDLLPLAQFLGGVCKKRATDRSRTCDNRFTKAMLYQLSYGGDRER